MADVKTQEQDEEFDPVEHQNDPDHQSDSDVSSSDELPAQDADGKEND